MPLHLLGKKSWNVYNADNIARVKADEAAAAADDAAEEQRIQEIDAARRTAILRGETLPTSPPLDEAGQHKNGTKRAARSNTHGRKRRKLTGEDDTDRDIRLAASLCSGNSEASYPASRLVKLRTPTSDAPLLDHAGNINLFPVDIKEQMRREKNEEAENEKRRKERALKEPYTMRISNAAGRAGLEQQPWYASNGGGTAGRSKSEETTIAFPGFHNKNVWGNEDPLRKEREQARMTSNDPFAMMQRAQIQLRKAKDDKKKWAAERDRDLMELRAAQEKPFPRENQDRRKREAEKRHHHPDRVGRERARSASHRHRDRDRSRSHERIGGPLVSHRHHERKRSQLP